MEDCFHLGAKALLWTSGKVLLLKRRNYWDIPGGRLERRESVLDGLHRELKEELGLKEVTGLFHVMLVLTNIRIPIQNGDVGLVLSVYQCEIPHFTPILSEEHDEFRWFIAEEAVEVLRDRYPPEFMLRILGPSGRGPSESD